MIFWWHIYGDVNNKFLTLNRIVFCSHQVMLKICTGSLRPSHRHILLLIIVSIFSGFAHYYSGLDWLNVLLSHLGTIIGGLSFFNQRNRVCDAHFYNIICLSTLLKCRSFRGPPAPWTPGQGVALDPPGALAAPSSFSGFSGFPTFTHGTTWSHSNSCHS